MTGIGRGRDASFHPASFDDACPYGNRMKPFHVPSPHLLTVPVPLAGASVAVEARAQATGDVSAGAEYGRDGSVLAGVVLAPVKIADSGRAVRAIVGTGGYDDGLDKQEHDLRGRVTRRIGSALRLGVEAIAQSDPNPDRQGLAVLALCRTRTPERSVAAGSRGGEGQISSGLVRTF